MAVLRNHKQMDLCEFQAIQGYIVRSCPPLPKREKGKP